MLADLREHLVTCEELFRIAQQEIAHPLPLEGEGRGEGAFDKQRRALLPRLDNSVARLKEHGRQWLSLSGEQRQASGDVRELIGRNQDMVMRILILDRHIEQLRLQHSQEALRALSKTNPEPRGRLDGVSPHHSHFVADIYRKHTR